MVVRSVNPRSPEAQCAGAREAVNSELAAHNKRGTWDYETVREYTSWMSDPSIPEAVAGRVFLILGVKNSELEQAHWSWKARAVFQGNNIRTKSGRSPYAIFDEIANAPASFTAARCMSVVEILLLIGKLIKRISKLAAIQDGSQ